MEAEMALGGIGLLRASFDLITSMRSSKTEAEVNAKAIELQQVIQSLFSSLAEAQEAKTNIEQEHRKLKDEVIRLKNFGADMERYKLTALESGGVVYALKQSMGKGEPAHYLCTNCYQATEKRILNCIQGRDRWFEFTCPGCQTAIPTRYHNATAPEYPPENP